MRRTFVIISVSDRVNDLNELVRGIKSLAKFDEYDINLLYQDNLGNANLIENRDRYRNIFIEPERLGCSWARLLLLQKIKYDIYVNLDDDMVLGECTHYSRAIEKCLKPGTGFVLTNWAKTGPLLWAKVPKMRNTFIKQTLVYNGGGMVYNDAVAELMRGLPPVKATFDNAWSLTAYINGYTNYRFLGSLAIHRICGTGGMKSFMKEEAHELTNTDLINYRFSKTGCGVCIPLDPDLTSETHRLHNQNKKG